LGYNNKDRGLKYLQSQKEKIRIEKIINLLLSAYPNSKCSLEYENAFQLLVATILSAQCTDKRVNLVTKKLFKDYPDANAFDKITIKKLEKLIFSTGFYKNKAKSILKTAKIIKKDYNGMVPNSINDLVKLPGVGRKTANVVLGTYYNIPSIVVDTHVTRIINLLGFTNTKDAVKIEFTLQKIINNKYWVKFTHLIIDHGRKVCVANRPQCHDCCLSELCPSSNK
tara:strand:+ start:426 stop:1100 length:675 start_codon:yes stop_codon:yes gene_type:complete